MIFTETFLDELPDEPILALKEICSKFLSGERTFEEHLEAFALLESFSEAHEYPIKLPQISSDQQNTATAIWTTLYNLSQDIQKEMDRITIEKAKRKFSVRFAKLFAYEFSEGDLAKLQSVINKLRKQIQEVKGLDAGHRSRLLRRLEQLQGELHKRVSDLDRFWGLVGEAGVIVGKLGEQAKPIIECIKMVADIVWATQGRAESLPSTAPNILQLNPSKDNEEENK